jgi:hypothetical protein
VRNGRRLIWAVTILTVGALGYGCAVLVWPELTIRSIEVIGVHRLTEADVCRQAGVELGEHLFAVSTRRIRRILAQVPQIESARVSRCLPGTVRIRVTERVPRIALVNSEGAWYVDANGVRFERVAGKNTAVAEGLPTVFLNSDIREKKAIQVALLCLEMGRGFEPHAVAEVGFPPDGSMVVVLDSGLRIEMGTPDLVYQKLRLAGRVLDANPDLYRWGEYVNVASVQDPVFRLRDGARKRSGREDTALQGG